MFTTGSKLFLGATAIAVIAAIVFGVTNGGAAGWTATVGLVSAAVALTVLTGLNFFVRDSNVSSMDPQAATSAPSTQRAPGNSMWPAFGAIGAVLLVVGLVTEPVVFKAGVVVLLAVLLEWMVQAWSERASGDRTYNAGVRKRILNPLEFPILGAVGLAVLIFSFSRIMLFVSKSAGPAIFVTIASLVLLGGFLFASKATLKGSLVAGVCTIAALGLVSTGAVMAIDGQREIEEHPTVGGSPQVCLSNDHTEVDERSSQTVAAKSNVAATVILEGGALRAQVIGMGAPSDTVTLPRSNPSNIVFRNLDAEPVRLTAHLGTFATAAGTTESPVTCTALTEEGGAQFLPLTIPQSSSATPDDPYRLEVPGIDGAITIVVP